MRAKPIASLLLCVLIAGLPGCGSTKPLRTGPKFAISEAAEASSAVIPVSLSDSRPKWERVYYAGATEPWQHRRAITFVPMENLQPSVGEMLKREISAATNRLADPPSRIRLEIRSFRVVYNDTKRYREWYEDIKRAEKRESDETDSSEDGFDIDWSARAEVKSKPPNWEHHLRRKRGQSKADYEAELRRRGKRKKHASQAAGNLAANVASEVFADAFEDTLEDAIPDTIDSIKTGIERVSDEDYVSQRVPKDIRKGYPAGLTCDIKVVALLTWDDGRSFTFTMRDQAFGPPPDSGEEAVNVPPVVDKAVKALSRRIASQTADWLSGTKRPSLLDHTVN